MTVLADPQARWWAQFLLRLFGSLLIAVVTVVGIMAGVQAVAAEPAGDTPAMHGEAAPTSHG